MHRGPSRTAEYCWIFPESHFTPCVESFWVHETLESENLTKERPERGRNTVLWRVHEGNTVRAAQSQMDPNKGLINIFIGRIHCRKSNRRASLKVMQIAKECKTKRFDGWMMIERWRKETKGSLSAIKWALRNHRRLHRIRLLGSQCPGSRTSKRRQRSIWGHKSTKHSLTKKRSLRVWASLELRKPVRGKTPARNKNNTIINWLAQVRHNQPDQRLQSFWRLLMHGQLRQQLTDFTHGEIFPTSEAVNSSAIWTWRMAELKGEVRTVIVIHADRMAAMTVELARIQQMHIDQMQEQTDHKQWGLTWSQTNRTGKSHVTRGQTHRLAFPKAPWLLVPWSNNSAKSKQWTSRSKRKAPGDGTALIRIDWWQIWRQEWSKSEWK